MTCFSWIILIVGGIFVMVSMIRWFEQVTDAVDQKEWNRVTLLVVLPLTVWFFPSKVSAGRPTAVPHHDPAMGFGVVVKPQGDSSAPFLCSIFSS
jgi:hypothetical protein